MSEQVQQQTASLSEAAASIESKVFDMLGIDEGGDDEAPAPKAVRDDTGKFKKPDAEPEAKAKDDAEAEAAAPEDEDDWIEDVSEVEGEPGKRYKLQEVLAGFKEKAKIAAELEDVKSRPIVVPEQIDRALQETVALAQNYAQTLQRWQAVNEPQPPHPSYGNPHHPNYNPEAYAQAMQSYHREVERWNAVDAERRQVEANTAQQQKAVEAARMQRHLAQIHEFWPEIKNKEAAQKVQTDLIQNFGKYGMTAELIASIDNPAFYALAKAALKGLQTEAVKEQAAKVVQAKPKLIKGQARQSTPSQNNSRQASFDRFAKTGSDADAYALAETFFG